MNTQDPSRGSLNFSTSLHVMGMQPIWRTKPKKISLPGIEIYSHVKQNLVLFSKLAAFPRTCMGSIFHIVPSTFQWNLDGFYADCNPTSSSYPSLYIFPLPLTGRSVAINTCTYDTRLQSIHATTTKVKKKEREREREREKALWKNPKGPPQPLSFFVFGDAINIKFAQNKRVSRLWFHG